MDIECDGCGEVLCAPAALFFSSPIPGHNGEYMLTSKRHICQGCEVDFEEYFGQLREANGLAVE